MDQHHNLIDRTQEAIGDQPGFDGLELLAEFIKLD
jgi:hypothetical protein